MIHIYYLEKDNQPIYVGYTNNPKHRENSHKQKYGNIKLIIIDEANEYNKKQLETFYINFFKENGYILLNKNEGGGGPKNHTQESINKIKNNRPKPKPRSTTWCDESRKKQSKILKGKPKPKGFGDMMRMVRIGKPKPKEMGEKLSLSLKGKPKKGSYKPINQYDLQDNFIQEWPSINHAAECTNSNSSTISKVCRGIFKQTNNFIWKYKE